MKKNNLKNIILVVIFVVLAPLILVGITSLSNSLVGKSKTTTSQTTEQQVAKVPEETKVTNDNLPKAKEEKSSNDKDSEQNQSNNDNNTNGNNQNNNNNATTGRTPTVGQDYVVKSGDSLFSIASAAYGEANAQNGVNKIKEANNLENNNITAGQKIQIPKL
ncbi:LysM peptidoglycan-binding domain-containing protein [Gemella morbillorum]